jgi:hypothetical protein
MQSHAGSSRAVHTLTLLLILMIALTTSCTGVSPRQDEPLATNPTPHYEYEIGLGYGFLGKEVQVTVDGQVVLTVYGTDEIEQHAQLLGTMMLAAAVSPKQDIIVRVIVNGSPPHEQSLDLSAGRYVHIYQEPTGMKIFNTRFLVQE